MQLWDRSLFLWLNLDPGDPHAFIAVAMFASEWLPDLVLGGLVLALHRGAATAARDATRARYDRLLDDLARLEAEGTDPDRRAAMRAELEALRERLDHDEASPGVGA